MSLKEVRKIDHIVYAVHDLDQAIKDVSVLTGATPVFGGYHTHKGTKNALLHLGNQCYLELITVDEANEKIKAPRWMGVDLIKEPRITRWSLKSTDLGADSEMLIAYQHDMGVIDKGSRKMTNGQTLQWGMILPLSQPAVDIIPFATDWQDSDVHPTDQLPETCALASLSLAHPNPNAARKTLKDLGLSMDIDTSPEPRITIQIKCPKGLVSLS